MLDTNEHFFLIQFCTCRNFLPNQQHCFLFLWMWVSSPFNYASTSFYLRQLVEILWFLWSFSGDMSQVFSNAFSNLPNPPNAMLPALGPSRSISVSVRGVGLVASASLPVVAGSIRAAIRLAAVRAVCNYTVVCGAHRQKAMANYWRTMPRKSQFSR